MSGNPTTGTPQLRPRGRGGFSLLESIIGMGILVVVSTALYLAYSNTLDIVSSGQYYSVAANIIESEVEAVRNMRYEDVGIVGGVPAGKLPATKSVSVDETLYTVLTFVRNVDDPFDGMLGGSPDDLDPNDYKLVQFHVLCELCFRFPEISMTTTVAPRNLENADKTGALLVRAVDADGAPLSGATVNIVNSSVVPPVNVADTTDINGELLLFGVATSSAGYRVTVSRSGFSTDRTYPPGDVANPNPTKPDLTVAQEQLTTATFAIDQTSTAQVSSRDQLCVSVPNVDFLLTGGKLIGTSPNVPKYNTSLQTGGLGTLNIAPLEWDDYSVQPTDTSWDIAGTSHPSPFTLEPGKALAVTWIMAPADPSAMLVSVIDQNGNPVNDATVQLATGSYDESLMSGRHIWFQSDWSGGQYAQQSGGIDTVTPGSLTLNPSGGPYATGSYSWLESNTVDFGTSSVSLFILSIEPSSQPADAGSDSIRVQVAANNDNSTWNFVGPDGTSGSYFTGSGEALPAAISAKRYLRYRVELRTLDSMTTPSLEAISLSYRSGCLPGGGAFFSGLTPDTYTLSISKSGYGTFQDTDVTITADWREYRVILTP